MIGRDRLKSITVFGRPLNFWTLHWVVVTPLMVAVNDYFHPDFIEKLISSLWMIFILLTFCFKFIFFWPFQGYQLLSYGDYTFTYSGEALGWSMFCLCVGPIPLFAGFHIFKVLVTEVQCFLNKHSKLINQHCKTQKLFSKRK